MQKQLQRPKAVSFGGQEKGMPFIDLDERVGFAKRQTLKCHLTLTDKPKPIVIFSDSVLFDTAKNRHDAGDMLASRCSAMRPDRVPSTEEFRRGFTFDVYSLYDLGISREAVSDSQLWNLYLNILTDLESSKPSQIYPAAKDFLGRLQEHFHIIVLAKDRINKAIAQTIKDQSGVSVNVIVATFDHGPIFGALSDHHHVNHGDVGIPCYFFGNTAASISTASEYRRWIRPVAVVTKEESDYDYDDGFTARCYQQSLISAGALSLVTHDDVPAVVYGHHSVDRKLKKQELLWI